MTDVGTHVRPLWQAVDLPQRGVGDVLLRFLLRAIGILLVLTVVTAYVLVRVALRLVIAGAVAMLTTSVGLTWMLRSAR